MDRSGLSFLFDRLGWVGFDYGSCFGSDRRQENGCFRGTVMNTTHFHGSSSAHIRNILVRSANWIGDAVMTTPALGMVREAFPRAEITVVANPVVAELFRYHPYCDRVIVFDKKKVHKGMAGFLNFCCELRRESFHLAVLFQNAIEAAIMARLAGIPARAGYRTDGRGFLLSHGVSVGASERRLHHTEYYRRMLRALGIQGGNGSLRLACTEEEISWSQSLLGGDRWVALHPGAAFGSAKRWHPGRFAAVADALTKEWKMRTLLIGGPDDAAIGQKVEAFMKAPVLNLMGKTSVRQMMALLSQCRLVVTNDSGPMHVAAAFHVPIVAIFGPTDHTTTAPLTDSCRIVRKEDVECAPCLLRQCPTDHRCMETVTVEDVLEAARSLLRENA